MILAIDTATRMVGVALHDGDSIVAEVTYQTNDHHTTELAPLIADTLHRAGLAATDLSGLAVARGPGSFTGLRIGMSVAKGMAITTTPPLPLIGVPTLDIVAAVQPPHADLLWAIAQAGRGRISAGLYRWQPLPAGWQPEAPVQITTWENLAQAIAGRTQVAGEIDPAGRHFLLAQGDHIMVSTPAVSLRRPGVLAEIAYARLRAGMVDNAESLVPLYPEP